FGNMNYIFRLRTAVSNVTGTDEMIAGTQRSVIHNFARPDADYLDYDITRTSLSGFGGNLMAGKIGGNWQFIYLSSWKSPGFEINDIGYMLMADMHMGVGVINYNIYKPFSVFRSMSFGTNLIHLMDFGGHTNAVAVSQSWTANYQNQWRTFLSGQLTSPETDNHLLRGGPAMKMPGQLYLSASIDSDWRKKLSGEVDFSVTRTFNDVMTSYELSFELEYRPFNTLTLNIEPGWSRTVNMMQYVTFRHLEGLNDQSERYIFGS